MTDVYLIRHGEAEGNDFRRMHGHYDSLLMPRGIAQAERVAARLTDTPIHGVFSSDLTRALLTAIPLCREKGLPLHREQAFREIQMGPWEDRPYGQLLAFEPEAMHAFHHDPVAWRLEGAETYVEYTDRFLTRLEEICREYYGGSVAVFCHGAVMRGVLIRLFLRDNFQQIPIADNTGVSHLRYQNGSYSYEYVNDSSHVPVEISTFAYQSWWRTKKTKPDMYFLPGREVESLPRELAGLPEGQIHLVGIWNGKPSAAVSLGEPEGDTGFLLGMRVLRELEGRNYSDQLLGCAFSHFRSRGCRKLRAVGDAYPENILSNFGFSGSVPERSIDTKGTLKAAMEQSGVMFA